MIPTLTRILLAAYVRADSQRLGSFAILRLIGLLLVRVAILRAAFRALLTFLPFGLFLISLSMLLLRFPARFVVLLVARFLLVLLLRLLSELLLAVLLFVSHELSSIYIFVREPNER